jgi:hypothetical protein
VVWHRPNKKKRVDDDPLAAMTGKRGVTSPRNAGRGRRAKRGG